MRASAPTQLVTVAACVGIVQVIAGVFLSFAKPEALASAATEGSLVYILGVSGLTAAWLAAWLLRSRLGPALALGVVGSAVAIALSASSASALGLIYYGELLVHHFLALIAAAICVLTGLRWSRDAQLGPLVLRGAPLVLAAVGGLVLVVQHVVSLPVLDLGAALPWQVGTAALLLAIPLALGLVWRELRWPARALAICVLAPLCARVVLGGAAGLSGISPGGSAAATMVASLVVAGVVAFLLLRPRVDTFARVFSLGVAGVFSYSLDRVYQGPRFQYYEERVGGLVRSILGFDLPYPSFVEGWKMATATVAVFTMTAAILAGALDSRERPKAMALALIVVAGFGLTSPQLVLMQAAGSLAFLASLPGAQAPAVAAVLCPPPEEPEKVLAEVAQRLEIDAPVVIEEASGTVIALRGEHDGSGLDLRARSSDGTRWIVVLRVGVVGRGSADAEVLPGGDEGHRLRGDPRLVGGEESGVLAALSAFPTATGRFWEAGCEIEFGDDLTRLRAASCEALLRALGRQLGA